MLCKYFYSLNKSLLLLLLFSFALNAQVPSYYSNIDLSQSPSNVKSQLSTLITNTHTTLIPYTSSYIDTWDVLKQSDLLNQTSDNVLLIYGYDDTDVLSINDYSRNKSLSCHSSSCIGLWNREHVFAKSLAYPSLDDSYPSAGTDVHNLRSCDSQMNSSRNNRIFQDASGNAHITSIGNFYPGDEWKGDVARVIMYMYTRYPTQCEAINIGYGNLNNTSTMPTIFLDWNVDDPVSQFEINRNEIIYSEQGNRNPFIDNPYLATVIWGGTVAEDTWNTLSVSTNLVESIKVYPTITSDYIYIKTDLENKDIAYSIYNTMGVEVLSVIQQNKIDVSSFSNGLYIIEIKCGHKSLIKKIIKI